MNSDDEQFCGRCLAGVTSDEHYGKCVAPGFASEGEPARDWDTEILVLEKRLEDLVHERYTTTDPDLVTLTDAYITTARAYIDMLSGNE